ncbi:putative TPR region domain-containing protein [Phytophthora infestans]|uniref:Putative TPR region domain-containing protein n=1 Tax=Phytophthora infestans TaxID=4787 RepID=A0A833WAR9_PHYIN|nr:putative TPR region domain-containing protein [Phytophthora infestans]KAI9995326.1 hypothetical protein PInf_012378 [Phytophthora infestans]
MPVRFALRKRQRQDENADKKKPRTSLSSVFPTIEALQQQEGNGSYARVKCEVGLLEDVIAKVRRLKEEGNTLAEAGRFRAAMGRWKEALVVDPDNAALYELLAQASMAVYEDFQAIQFARKATKLAPTWSDGFLTLARCQLNFGELALAREALKQAVEHNGGKETKEMTSDRRDIDHLLIKQEQVLCQRDEEAAHILEVDKLQVISCFKHLSLRGKAIDNANTPANE